MIKLINILNEMRVNPPGLSLDASIKKFLQEDNNYNLVVGLQDNETLEIIPETYVEKRIFHTLEKNKHNPENPHTFIINNSEYWIYNNYDNTYFVIEII